MNEEQAQKRIDELKGYYGHLAAYVVVNLFLIGLNLMTSPDDLWFGYPLFGWGIGMALHTVGVFWTSKDWEARKMEELTGLKHTQEELLRLSDRTDALVTILASVDWQKIDPEILQTRQTLEDAKERIAGLQAGKDSASQKEVTREIEKLEAFVTGPKFAYYDQAAKGD